MSNPRDIIQLGTVVEYRSLLSDIFTDLVGLLGYSRPAFNYQLRESMGDNVLRIISSGQAPIQRAVGGLMISWHCEAINSEDAAYIWERVRNTAEALRKTAQYGINDSTR